MDRKYKHPESSAQKFWKLVSGTFHFFWNSRADSCKACKFSTSNQRPCRRPSSWGRITSRARFSIKWGCGWSPDSACKYALKGLKPNGSGSRVFHLVFSRTDVSKSQTNRSQHTSPLGGPHWEILALAYLPLKNGFDEAYCQVAGLLRVKSWQCVISRNQAIFSNYVHWSCSVPTGFGNCQILLSLPLFSIGPFWTLKSLPEKETPRSLLSHETCTSTHSPLLIPTMIEASTSQTGRTLSSIMEYCNRRKECNQQILKCRKQRIIGHFHNPLKE